MTELYFSSGQRYISIKYKGITNKYLVIKTLYEDKYKNSSMLATIIMSEFKLRFFDHKIIELQLKSLQTKKSS